MLMKTLFQCHKNHEIVQNLNSHNTFPHILGCIIVLYGPEMEKEHAVITNQNGRVVLTPLRNSKCTVNGLDISRPVELTQGRLSIKCHIVGGVIRPRSSKVLNVQESPPKWLP